MRRSTKKSKLVDDGQLSLFLVAQEIQDPTAHSQPPDATAGPATEPPADPEPAPRARAVRRSIPAPRSIKIALEIPRDEVVLADEWWTTDKVCAFLRLGRKAIWERRRNPAFAFPSPANLGGGRNHYRASAIRMWAERMARASMPAQD